MAYVVVATFQIGSDSYGISASACCPPKILESDTVVSENWIAPPLEGR